MRSTFVIALKLVLLAVSVTLMLGSGICSAWFLYEGGVHGFEMALLNLLGWALACTAAVGAHHAWRALVAKPGTNSRQ